MNHAAVLFGSDGQNYLFKDSGPGWNIQNYSIFIQISNNLLFYLNLLEKVLKEPISDSDHVKNGWWIDFRNVSSIENLAISDDELG